jgi:metal-sulfur cluster biosynthetic enzyme
MGCPGMDMILDDVRSRLLDEPGVEDVDIEVVWHPIWTKDRLSEDAKMMLREWGISL